MKKILIIEDEKIIRNELKSLLENSGYEVLIIEKFDNVKENIKNMKFDLISFMRDFVQQKTEKTNVTLHNNAIYGIFFHPSHRIFL